MKEKIDEKPSIGIIIGSSSDWATMQEAHFVLEDFGVPPEYSVVSAHRTPDLLTEYASNAGNRGLKIIITGARVAAHLPGMVSAPTLLPVLGVPVESSALMGLDSLLSIVQMPAGIPVGTMAIGKTGVKNAALLAVTILATDDPALHERLAVFRKNQSDSVLNVTLPT